MKYLKLLMMASLLSFYGCNGDDDDGGSSSSSSNTFSCALAESQFGSFEDVDLDSAKASCTNGIVTIETSGETEATTFKCKDQEGEEYGDDIQAKLYSGTITMDLTQTTITDEGPEGAITFVANFNAQFNGDSEVTGCSFSFSNSTDGTDTADPMANATCTVDDISFDMGTFGGDCSTGNASAKVAMFFNYFEQLSDLGGEED